MPDERVVELCRLWWEKAREDLLAAERLADLPFICCFHSSDFMRYVQAGIAAVNPEDM